MRHSAAIQSGRSLLLLIAAGATLAGIYFRFTGLGAAPLSVDEYYLARSIENVLRTGLPEFSCGGYYTRGVLQQYLSAALQSGGMSAELAPRFIAALCSLLVLPAAYLLGRRMHGRTVGLLAVTVLALSVWEIEMARFGRMYAPFQPVCAWYLLFFVRYTVDRDTRALWPMLLLSILAPLVWEGGALLALLNLLPIFLQQAPAARLKKTELIQLGLAALLFVAAYWWVTHDFRGYNLASWPPGFSPALSVAHVDPIAIFSPPIMRLSQHPGWAVMAIVPLFAALYALRWLWGKRGQPLTVAGLLVIVIAALLQQFAVVIGAALLLLLTGFITWKELFTRQAAALHVAIVLSALYWLAFGAATADWHSPAIDGLPKALAAYAYPYIAFPDFVGVVVRPWVRAVPMLAAGLFVLTGAAVLRQARSESPLTPERALLVAFVVLLLAASTSHPPRQETRYIFFLYPLAIVIALTTIARGAQWLVKRQSAALMTTAAIALGGFALSEDFQPYHLRNIDRPAELFRSRMNPDMQAHLEIRNDYRELGAWLRQRVVADSDVVINGVHGLDFYYPQISQFFVDERDPDLPSWSCQRGSVERWGNYPMLYTVNALKARIAASRTTYLIVYPANNPGLLTSLAAFAPQVAWTQGYVAVIVLHGSRL
jgi:hypothetical protein